MPRVFAAAAHSSSVWQMVLSDVASSIEAEEVEEVEVEEEEEVAWTVPQ